MIRRPSPPTLLFALLGLAPAVAADEPPAPGGEEIRIGLFLASDPAVAAEMEAGAQAAQESLAEPRLQLVTRRASATWDGGARRAAQLLYEDGAVALIAPPDPREAHEAALVATRAKVPIVHLSTDPRLQKNRIPWFFRIVPDDERIAAQLAAAARSLASDPVVCYRPGFRATGFAAPRSQEPRLADLLVERLPALAPTPHLLFASAEEGRGVLSSRVMVAASSAGPGPRLPVQSLAILARAACEDAVVALGRAALSANGRSDRIPAELRRLAAIRGRLGPFRFDKSGGRDVDLPVFEWTGAHAVFIEMTGPGDTAPPAAPSKRCPPFDNTPVPSSPSARCPEDIHRSHGP